jgi:hypothetical protein
MKAGKIDRRLTILKRTEDDSGDWGPVYTYLPWLAMWSSIQYDKADEEFAANELYSMRIMTFQTRWFAGVDDRDRLECEGQYYDILGIREIGRRDGLEFKAQWRPDNADGQ